MIIKINSENTLESLVIDFIIKTYEPFSRSYKKEEVQNYLTQPEKTIGFIFETKIYKSSKSRCHQMKF